MASSRDSYPVRSPGSRRNPRPSLDPATPDRLSGADPLAVGLGAAVDLFLAAKAAEARGWRMAANPATRIRPGREEAIG